MTSLCQAELATGRLSVQVHEAAFPLEELVGFAARDNRKRGFLFVSKVLGKHWPVAPSRMRQIHDHLASRLDLGPGPSLFVAMAETATGLGQGIFESVLGRRAGTEALFIHSTRYRVADRAFLEFEEPHCHAPDQLLYEPTRPHQLALFRNARELILVDDEISTGATLCNLVAAYRSRNPQLERVWFVTITDFSGQESSERFSRELGLPLSCVAVLKASFSFRPTQMPDGEQAAAAVGANWRASEQIARDLGRFGIDRRLRVPSADIDRLSQGLAPGAPVLVLGTGEFMHLAFRIGLLLEARGFAVTMQATTRSPIRLGGDIGRRLVFADNYREGIRNYLYNVEPDAFARIVLCHETRVEGVADLVQKLGSGCLTYRCTTEQG